MAYKFQLGDAVISGSLTAKQGSVQASGSLVDIALRDNAGVRRFDVDYQGANVRLRLKNAGGASKTILGESLISGSGDLKTTGALIVGGQQYGINANGAVTGSSAALTSLSVGDGNITNVGDIALDSISADGSSFSFASDWTAAGRTCANLGTVTTADINGGSVDGATIGAASQSSGKFTTMSGSSTLEVGGIMTTAGTVKLLGVADTAIAVASDSMYFLDGDGLMKSERLTDYAAALVESEPGFASTGGKLQYDPNSLTAAAIASGDSISFVDANDSNIPKKETIDDVATLFAGAGLAAASAVLAVQVSGAVHVSSDKVSLSGSLAGDGLGYSGGVDSIMDLKVNVDNSSIELSGDALRVKAAGVTDAMLNDDVATGLAGVGLSAASGVMAIDLNELGAAAVDVSADSIAIIDANDSNGSKKESIADLVSAMAGAGLTATNGVLSTDAGATPTGVGDANATLTEGTTYGTTTLTADRTWSLPAAPDAGDMVRVKAPPSLGGFELVIAKQGSHTIDGLGTISLQSDSASVTLIYVAANLWKIV